MMIRPRESTLAFLYNTTAPTQPTTSEFIHVLYIMLNCNALSLSLLIVAHIFNRMTVTCLSTSVKYYVYEHTHPRWKYVSGLWYVPSSGSGSTTWPAAVWELELWSLSLSEPLSDSAGFFLGRIVMTKLCRKSRNSNQPKYCSETFDKSFVFIRQTWLTFLLKTEI